VTFYFDPDTGTVRTPVEQEELSSRAPSELEMDRAVLVECGGATAMCEQAMDVLRNRGFPDVRIATLLPLTN
jgi:hypothetical protein